MNAENIKKVLVIGGTGTMGQGIAQNFAEAGIEVVITGRSQETCTRALTQIQANCELIEEYGLLKEEPVAIRDRIWAVATQDYAQVANECDFVVETVSENLELKQQIFRQLDGIRPEIVIGSDTSSCPVASISEGCTSPERMIGMHYFNPAHIMPLVEIHYGPATSADNIALTKELLMRVGKTPVIVKKDIYGLLGTRIQLAMIREIESLIAQDVASLEDINLVAQASYGMRHACIGHIEALDMFGLDTMAVIEGRIFPQLSNANGPSELLKQKVAKGDLGVKTGRGWIDYEDRPRAQVLDSQNRRLLRQLELYKQLEKDCQR
ncbi:MAG: 3-hydroxyacyl-CoA dehydrogenase family protein [Actinobacteria bacterium]|nr:3-hydroxyacyl-CoA dehydrogenase family protein [Actinomycetota bacterium]